MYKKIFLLIAFTLVFSNQNFAQYKIETYAGVGEQGNENGERITASFNHPFGICKDKDGNLLIADSENNLIRKIDADGKVSTLAGSGEAGNRDGQMLEAQFNSPTSLSFDSMGNLFVIDFLNHTIRKITPDGIVSTFAGSGKVGCKDGITTDAEFNYPRSVVIDHSNNLFVSDSWNHRIRKISPDGNVTTFAGGGMPDIDTEIYGAWKDGQDTTARFFTPCGLAIDSEDNIYVADALNHRIRKINQHGMVTTVAGFGESGKTTGRFADGDLTVAKFNTPTEIFVLKNKNILVSDTYNNRIRIINTAGVVATIAGNGNAGLKNGNSAESELNFPRGLSVDYENSRIYFVDFNNNSVRVILLEGK